MADFINLDAAYDIDTLTDWYISSVDSNPPVWTDEHIAELLNDFYVIPKDTLTADVAPVHLGHWITTDNNTFKCSNCGYEFEHEGYKHYFNYCPCCGAKMDGDTK